MKKDSGKNEPKNLGACGGLYGHAVTAVLRRLGKEGVSTAHVRAIMEAKGVKVSPTTVSIQVNAGRTKGYADRGEPADLTAAQLKELMNAAPEPKPEPKAESKK